MNFWSFVTHNRFEIASLTLEHLWMVALSTLLAIAVGIPLGILITRKRSLHKPVIAVANIIQTVPSLALFGFLLPAPWIGERAGRLAIFALMAYALLPLIRNTYVGITSEDLTPGIARRFGYPVKYGAVITSVRPDSPGARAGLRGGTDERDFNGVAFTYGGDVLVAVDGSAVRGANDVVRLVAERLRPGQVSTFTIVRDGTRRRVRIVLGTRPGNPDAR